MEKLRIVTAAAALTVFGSLWGWMTNGWLFDWIYTLPPVSVWRAPVDMTPLFWIVCYAGSFILALVFVAVFRRIAMGLHGPWPVKGVSFGFIVWLTGAVPHLFMAALFLAVTIAWPLYMAVNLLIALPLAGCIAALIAAPRPSATSPQMTLTSPD